MKVREVVDALVTNEITLQQAADIFKRFDWQERQQATEAEAYGVVDDDAPDDDSWSTVETDPRITAEQYAVLAAAFSSTF